MKEFQRKKRLKNALYSPLLLSILAIILIFLFRGAWSVYKKDKLSLQNLEQEKMELQKILDRHDNLVASLNYLKTDQGVESEIRSKFRAVKQDEKVSVIIDDKKPETAGHATTTKSSLWYRIFKWF